MTMTTLTSREFNRETGRAKRATAEGPVVITDRGKPTHVLLSVSDYERIVAGKATIIEKLGWPPGIEDIDIAFPRSREGPREVDLF